MHEDKNHDTLKLLSMNKNEMKTFQGDEIQSELIRLWLIEGGQLTPMQK